MSDTGRNMVGHLCALIAVVVLLVADITWVWAMSPMYSRLVRGVQGRNLQASIGPAVLAYALMVVGLLWIVLPSAARSGRGMQNKLWVAATTGGLFGLVVYGIFNATNTAIFHGYDWRVALIDTTWGTFVFSLATAVALYSQACS